MNRVITNIDYDKYDNFIFDLYGTLIDLHTDERSTLTWKKWMKWLDDNNIKHTFYPIFRHSFFKMDKLFRADARKNPEISWPEIDVIDIYRILFTKYGNNLNEDALNKASYAFRFASIEYIRLYPGVKEYLKKLRSIGKKIYILSNAQASYTRPEIIKFELDKLVDDYYLSSDYKCMKPDIKYYNTIINDKKLNTERSIMIGDNNISDIQGAIEAGLYAYQIKNGDLFI